MFRYTNTHTNTPVNVVLFSTLIRILHRELLNYIRKRANSSISSLKKDYLRNFTISTLSDDEKISIQDAMFFGSHGYFVNDTEEDKENHHTPATIAHTAILLNFYYSILIFCYEYGLNNLAKNIFGNADNLSAVLFITSDSYEKTLECQLLQKYYSVLFSNLPFDQIQQKIVQLFCIFENGTFKKQFKQYSKKLSKQSIFSEYRLPFFMFLRVSLFHMQLTFSLIYKNADYMENYKSLVCDVANITHRLKPKISMDPLWKQEMAAFYIHRKIISVLYKTPIDVIEIEGSSILFATHLYIYKLVLEPFDIPGQCFQLGDLTPATTFLIKLIQNFSRNKPTD